MFDSLPAILSSFVDILWTQGVNRKGKYYGLKNSSSYEPTGEKSLEMDEVYTEKIS